MSETERERVKILYIVMLLFPSSRLVILLQRRKKYKSRTILGYKTLAEGVIRMDAVLQKSMDMIIELTASGKNGRPGTVVACLRAERVSSIPVDHDNKNNNSVLLAGESPHRALLRPGPLLHARFTSHAAAKQLIAKSLRSQA